MDATATTSEHKTRTEAHALITEKVIEQLTRGNVPWQKLWGDTGAPINLITKKPFRGINALLLGMEEYEQNLFLTFDQAKEIGAKIKKGSKGHPAMYWRKAQSAQASTEGKNKGSLEYYMVFNIAQCENIPEPYRSAKSNALAHPSFEYILASMPNCPKIQHKEPNSYYDVVEDILHMPKKSGSKKNAEYCAMLFRQLIHSTGHDSRLARKGMVEMTELSGTSLHSKEDLIAEIGVCFLMSHAGMPMTFKNGPGYVPEWLAKFNSDKWILGNAAVEAQKAVDYILNVKEVEEEKHSGGE
jgi:antirestriction protein ArdC